jgi:type VI protein secretion system component Hcp
MKIKDAAGNERTERYITTRVKDVKIVRVSERKPRSDSRFIKSDFLTWDQELNQKAG